MTVSCYYLYSSYCYYLQPWCLVVARFLPNVGSQLHVIALGRAAGLRVCFDGVAYEHTPRWPLCWSAVMPDCCKTSVIHCCWIGLIDWLRHLMVDESDWLLDCCFIGYTSLCHRLFDLVVAESDWLIDRWIWFLVKLIEWASVVVSDSWLIVYSVVLSCNKSFVDPIIVVSDVLRWVIDCFGWCWSVRSYVECWGFGCGRIVGSCRFCVCAFGFRTALDCVGVGLISVLLIQV